MGGWQSNGEETKRRSDERPRDGLISHVLRPGRALPVFCAALVLWCFSAWFLADQLREGRELRLIEHEWEDAEGSAATIAANIELGLAHLRSIPAMLSRDPDVVSVLAQLGPDVQASSLPLARRREIWQADPELKALSRRFSETLTDVGVSQIWVMDAAGDCIASAGFAPEATATGANYADRAYFRAGLAEQSGRQFAVGRTSNIPGLYYSSPVIRDRRILGVVTVKIEMDSLARWVHDPNVFVADENGVIILAGDKRLLMQAIPGAKVAGMALEDIRSRYKMTSFEPVHMASAGQVGQFPLVRWGDEETPSVLAVVDRVNDIMSVHVLGSLRGLAGMRDDRLWSFLLLATTGASVLAMLTGGAVYLRTKTEHAREMAKANADLAELNAILERQANTDSLTGCANRRQFMTLLDAERRRAVRYAGSFSIALFDLDHFKGINDRYGHAAGDLALCQFVQVSSAVLRSTDVLGRVGGDEFAVLMPQTDANAAFTLTERIRQAILSSPAVFNEIPLPLAASVGIAQWHGGDHESTEDLLGRADAALYAAKDQRVAI